MRIPIKTNTQDRQNINETNAALVGLLTLVRSTYSLNQLIRTQVAIIPATMKK